jgi:hypothetical protein
LARDGGLSNDASDSIDPEVSFDAATDGSTLDASDGSGGAVGAAEGGADSSVDGAAPQCDGMVCAPRCNLTGTYALKFTVPTTWPSSAQLSSGSGTFEFRLRLRATHVDNQATIQLRECSQKLPAIHAQLANEDHLLTYPDSLYDSGKLPGASATMTLGDSTPKSSLSLPPVALEMGVDLNDPLNDAWPSTAAALLDAVRVDVEGDGNPGVTGIYSTSGRYVYPRTSTSLIPQRAQQVYLAVRWVFSMSGVLTSCDGSEGDVTLAKLDSRIVGCRHADGSLCSTSEANHLDTNLPKFRFGAATYVLSRVAEDASCQAVRALP